MKPDQFLTFDSAWQAHVIHVSDGDQLAEFSADVEAWIDQLSTERPAIRRPDGVIVAGMSDHEQYAGALRRAIATAREGAARLAKDELADVVARVTAEWTRGHREKKMTSAVRAEHAAAAEVKRVKREARAAKSGA